MLQLHLSDQQLYCLQRCSLYQRFDGNILFADKAQIISHGAIKPNEFTMIINGLYVMQMHISTGCMYCMYACVITSMA